MASEICDRHSASALRATVRREKNGRVASRMLAIANAPEGMSRADAARAAGMDRQTLRDWVLRYNAEDVAGLLDRPKGHPAARLPFANTEMMNIYLAEFAKTIPEDVHVVLVLDGAGWHGKAALDGPDAITLVPLPPYSPKLNPVERLWLYLKETCLSLRVFADQAAIIDACCQAWNRATADAARITHHLAPQLPMDQGSQFMSSAV